MRSLCQTAIDFVVEAGLQGLEGGLSLCKLPCQLLTALLQAIALGRQAAALKRHLLILALMLRQALSQLQGNFSTFLRLHLSLQASKLLPDIVNPVTMTSQKQSPSIVLTSELILTLHKPVAWLYALS